jgi:hypothetical protein
MRTGNMNKDTFVFPDLSLMYIVSNPAYKSAVNQVTVLFLICIFCKAISVVYDLNNLKQERIIKTTLHILCKLSEMTSYDEMDKRMDTRNEI